MSHAEEVAGRVEDLLVHFERPSLPGEPLDAGPRHGADELGNVREPGFRRGSPADGDRLAGLVAGASPFPGIIAENGHLPPDVLDAPCR